MKILGSYEELKRVLLGYRRPAIIYHWDADGIISAYMLAAVYGEDSILLPPKFTFRPAREFYESLSGSCRFIDSVIVVDLAFSREVLQGISTSCPRPLVVLDHHVGGPPEGLEGLVYFNPAAAGDPAGEFPSSSHMLAQAFKSYNPVIIAASIVGDLGESARNNGWYRRYMAEARLDPEADYWLPREIVDQLSSIEIMAKYEALKWFPRLMSLSTVEPVKAVLNDAYLITLRAQAESELSELIDRAEEGSTRVGPGFILYRLEGDGRHASRLIRRLASLRRDHIIILDYTSRMARERRVYVRGNPLGTRLGEVRKIIADLRKRGYSAGGKAQKDSPVIGVELDVEDDRALDEIIQVLTSYIS